MVLNRGRIEQAGTPEELYHHPAAPFVYNFLGNVNLFHRRVRDGKVYIRDTQVAVNPGRDRVGVDGQSAAVYIRPHLLDILLTPNGGSSFPPTVGHINSAGTTVKVELTSQWGDRVHVEIDHQRFRALRLERETQVYLSPRENKVFIYQI